MFGVRKKFPSIISALFAVIVITPSRLFLHSDFSFRRLHDILVPSAYDEWDRNARAAREAYVTGEIDAAEFLRRIEHDGETPASVPAELGKSTWQRSVERNLNFDPWLEYADMMSLDLGAEVLIRPISDVFGGELKTGILAARYKKIHIMLANINRI